MKKIRKEVTQLQKLYKLGGVSKEEFEDLKARIINKSRK